MAFGGYESFTNHIFYNLLIPDEGHQEEGLCEVAFIFTFTQPTIEQILQRIERAIGGARVIFSPQGTHPVSGSLLERLAAQLDIPSLKREKLHRALYNLLSPRLIGAGVKYLGLRYGVVPFSELKLHKEELERESWYVTRIMQDHGLMRKGLGEEVRMSIRIMGGGLPNAGVIEYLIDTQAYSSTLFQVEMKEYNPILVKNLANGVYLWVVAEGTPPQDRSSSVIQIPKVEDYTSEIIEECAVLGAKLLLEFKQLYQRGDKRLIF
ncbi:hypothetical protein DRJ48_04505 [Candidatus Woesearchaeota archaeon]|nr:hypothetical protein [Candidatus Woesearchaeota archaeon]RLE41964.1 MAG: hypothetical protein DRJ48_04505 [Candidatus Woesearchaeota archaeon]